nr:MAG TPA: hypothetical protein [Caudoviricetes sp.]
MARRGENIYKRKDGRWEGRCIIGHGKNGRAAFRSLYGHSYKEVKEKLLIISPYSVLVIMQIIKTIFTILLT